MTANSKEDEKNSNILDEILNKLTNSNLISIFFLLMGNYIQPEKYLEIIKQNEIEKKKYLRKILQSQHSSFKNLLIEILWTIKRYDLLKSLDVCRHNYQCPSSLNKIWKSMYEVCESFDIEKDLECFKKVFPELSISDEELSEIFLVEKFNSKMITTSGLSALLTDLNKDCQKSKTWALIEKYFIKQPTIKSPCGLAVIINHENFISEKSAPKLERRKCSSLDVGALEKLWQSFGLVTQTHIDLKENEVLHTFQELSEKDLSFSDILVVCYMSHGNEGVVYSSDCKPIQISRLVDFMANKCKSLVDKPKLFFIQACQGSQIQCGISNPVFSLQPVVTASLNNYPTDNTPYFVDVLIAVSTISGFVSFVPDNNNSWFVQALVENIEQFGHKKNFTDIMIKVTNDVSNKRGEYNLRGQKIENCKQTVETKSTLRKELFLKKICD